MSVSEFGRDAMGVERKCARVKERETNKIYCFQK